MKLVAGAAIGLALIGATPCLVGQQDSFEKHFTRFPSSVPNVDLYAGVTSILTPFKEPLRKSYESLVTFLDRDLVPGAIVVCSTSEQRDSVNETKLLRKGYRWVLIQLTAEAVNQKVLAQIKTRFGGKIPEPILRRFENPAPERRAADERRLVSQSVGQFTKAALQMTLSPEKKFRGSRIDDMGRSPLADWLDIGLATYASGSWNNNLKFLRERLEEAFYFEDLLDMSRPFVLPAFGESGDYSFGRVIVRRESGQSGHGGQNRTTTGSTRAYSPGAAPETVLASGSIPKDQQDRMLFDAQAGALFAYLVERIGVRRTKELIQWSRKGNETREFVLRADALGEDVEEAEARWLDWINAQDAPEPAQLLFRSRGRGGPAPPG